MGAFSSCAIILEDIDTTSGAKDVAAAARLNLPSHLQLAYIACIRADYVPLEFSAGVKHPRGDDT